MTVGELIEVLDRFDKDKVVILSDGTGWDNIGQVKEVGSSVEIQFDAGRED